MEFNFSFLIIITKKKKKKLGYNEFKMLLKKSFLKFKN